MTHTLLFSQLNREDVPRAGGKGANLGELVQAGFPVPPGFVLTTAAYDAFVAHNNLQAQTVAIARQVPGDDPAAGEAAAAEIRQLFLGGEMPEAIADGLRAAYAELAAEFDGDAVAVRSSATAEDLPSASFAGQQETFLNVQGEAALLKAVRECWASLWTARAMAYRARQGIDPAEVSLAVVVQALVEADVSGILFTANPSSGEREELIINASYGLGEAIVSGAVTPDSWTLARESGAVKERTLGTKALTIQPDGDGTTTRETPADRRGSASLSDEQLAELAALGRRVEAHFGTPQDVEWAMAGGKLWLLQARPITGLPPAPLKDVRWEPPIPDTIWMRRQIVEHMPEPLSPLFEDLYLRQGLDESINELTELMATATGVPFDLKNMMPQGFARTINGYAYTTASFEMSWKNILTIVKIYSRIFRLFNTTLFSWEEKALPHYQSLIERWGAIDLAQAEDDELLRGIAELAAADSAYWFGSAVNLGLSRILDPTFDWLLKSPLFRRGLPRPGMGSTAFLRGFDSKALDAQAELETLADVIRQDDSLWALVLKTPPDRLLTALTDHPHGQPVLDEIQRYLDEYGHQIYNLDFAEPTQNEDPQPVLLSLRALMQNPPQQDVRARQAQMAAERDALVAQTEQRLNPLALRLFRWVWKWTKEYAPYRESVMFYMGAAWPALRTLAGELGQRLADAGAIAQADDIYFLESREIRQAIDARASGQPAPDFTQPVQARRELREARKRLPPQPKVPQQSSLKVGPLDLSMFDPTPEDGESDGPVLTGYAVSTGRVTAPASVIHSAQEFDQMQPGTVLVCTTTTPAWTPLFSQAVGLVTDIGGALAHGSIVAREYGIPAVMGTGNATDRIQSGALLAVDGDAGTVTLLDEADEPAAAPAEAPAPEAGTSKKWLFALAAGIIGFLWWRRRRR